MQNFFTSILITTSSKRRSSSSEMFYKTCFLKTFTKFTEKHLCRSLLLEACNFIKTKIPTTDLFFSILQEIYERLLLKKEASTVTTRSEACKKFVVFLYSRALFFGNIKYLQQKKNKQTKTNKQTNKQNKKNKKKQKVIQIFVQCIKLDENKASDRTSIREYSETLSYSNFPCSGRHIV